MTAVTENRVRNAENGICENSLFREFDDSVESQNPFSVLRSPFSVLRSPFSVLRSLNGVAGAVAPAHRPAAVFSLSFSEKKKRRRDGGTGAKAPATP